ncbi:MAG: hypothetical protein L6Q35_04815, partial [Phycisphaerales bacterium]|nr:hypothetical protein [Phycisphaerales bacterium]
IFLYDDAKAVQKKINGIKTDRPTTTSPLPEGNALAQYIDAFLPHQRAEEIKAMYASGKEVMDGHIKAEVGAAINALIDPMRARRAELETPTGEEKVLGVIRDGIRKANAVAEETLHLAKKAMGLDFGKRVVE